MKIVIFITLVLIACLAYEISARDYVESMCYAAMWNSGANAQVKKIFPLKRVDPATGKYQTAAQYFSYGTPYGASANTPDGLEEESVAQYYFFDDDEEVSIFFYFDKWRDPSGGIVAATITSEGLAGKGAEVTVRDDPGDSSYAWNDSDGTSTPFWRWWPCCTDGMVLGKLPNPVEKLGNGNNPRFNPSDHSFCVNIQFTQQEGVTQFKVQSLANYLELTTPSRVISAFPIPSSQANTLRLCYTQCNCIQNAILEANRGSFDNKAVVEGNGAGSGIGRYAADSSCSWIIQPAINPQHVVVYFKEFIFADFAPNDYVQFARDDQGNTIIDTFPTSGEDSLDWTADISAGRNIPHPKKGSINLSEFNKVLIQRSGPTFASKVSFESAAASTGALGFTVTYVSVATTDSLSPTDINDAGGVSITVTGKYILNAEHLTCKIDVDTETFYVDARYVSATSAVCIVPMKPAAATSNAGTVSISNDGVEFFNTQPFTYYSATCDLLLDCKSCSASPVCGWCASVANYYGASSCMTVPNTGDPSIAPAECPAPANTWHPSCCNRCPDFNECNSGTSQGVCGCDQTCSCLNNTANTISYQGPTCDCACPKNERGICSGSGSCNCTSGTCDCSGTARGDTCECLQCKGDERGPCYGSGTCNCDGTCTCLSGFDPSTWCQCPTTCELGSNGLVCGGESQGECVCGDCICKEGYTSSRTCDCKDRCVNNPSVPDCYGHGSCGCDGTCVCDVGFTGPECKQEVKCEQSSCETCQDSFTDKSGNLTDQSFCVWCPITGKCVNDNSANPCYPPEDKDPSLAETENDDKVYLLAAECPVLEIVDTNPIRAPDDSLPIVAIIAAIIGVIVAAIIAAVLCFLGKTQTEGLANFDFGGDQMGAATQNPLFASEGTTGTNTLYQPS